MDCLKCGKQTKNEQLFCEECLSGMDAYPVKPDVHVQLPNRPTVPPSKKSGRKRRMPTPEEQIFQLRTRIRRLRVSVILLLALLGVISAILVHTITIQKHVDLSEIGKNYTFVNPFE